MDNWIQETCYISVVTSGPDETSNFNETWNHQCLNERRKWREANTKELYSMETKKGWKNICKSEVPNDRRFIGCKRVSKSKWMEHTEQDKLLWATGKNQVWISLTFLHLW